MKQGDKVKWINGVGFECEGTVESDTTDFMIPVRTNDDRILHIRYVDLRLIDTIEEGNNG